MSRSYRGIRPKANRVYSIEDALSLYGICRNTLCNWVKAGLQPVGESHKQLFRGLEFKRFHDQRKLKNKSPLRLKEFKCLTCKLRVVPDVSTLSLAELLHQHSRAEATCPDCARSLSKLLNETAYNTLKKCLESNTSLHCIDEVKGATPTGIGIKPGQTCVSCTAENERVIYDYQIYAGRYDTRV